MSHDWRRGRFIPWAMMWLLAQMGCSSGPVNEAYLPVPGSLYGPFTATYSTVHPGRLDEANRFLPAVGVNTPAKKDEGEDDCSGVLLGSRWVLTAGHCVCMRRMVTASDTVRVKRAVEKVISSLSQEEKAATVKLLLEKAQSIIDSSNCAESSAITVINYLPSAEAGSGGDEADLNYRARQYNATRIRPHEDLMILYDRRGRAIFREADLAAVILDKPVRGAMPSVKLAESAPEVGDHIVMVGYGYGRTEKGARTYGNRHFGESVIADIGLSDAPDIKLYVQGESRRGELPSGIYGGDSGGPCFSKTDETALVGIAAGVTSTDEADKRSVFTSIFPHREWIRRIMGSGDSGAR